MINDQIVISLNNNLEQSDMVTEYYANQTTNDKLIFKDHCIGPIGDTNVGNEDGIPLEIPNNRVLLYKDPTKMLGL